MLIHLHGNSLDWRSKLVDFHVPLETHKNVGWKGPPQPNPSAQGRAAFTGDDLSRMKTSKDGDLKAPTKLRLLCFNSHYSEFSPYGLPEFPLLQLFFPVTNILSVIISPIDRKGCFVSFL